MQNDYIIRSLNSLETTASSLDSNNNVLINDINSLKYICRTIRENWENDQGQDLASILSTLDNTIGTLENELVPIIKKYVEVVNTVVAESRKNQSTSLQ